MCVNNRKNAIKKFTNKLTRCLQTKTTPLTKILMTTTTQANIDYRSDRLITGWSLIYL